MSDLSRRELIAGSIALTAPLPAFAQPRKAAAPRTSFKPGDVWRDTAGKPIQCHAGSIIQVEGVFYWYGENKEFTTGKTDVWTWGIRCYRSSDLYNWEDQGLIIPPDMTDRSRPLHPSRFIDRPHIIYNARTKKFVCWLKIMGERYQTRTVLRADRITGPYTLIRTDIRPLGMGAGDFDLAISPDDGKAYMYFSRVHREMICADLTDDYTDFTGYYSTHLTRPGVPHVREGTSHFRRNNKHYLLTSGTTGYHPNPSEAAVAETFHGPWRDLGDVHPTDRSRTSFNSQIGSVFKHPGKKDLYIAIADRWIGPQTSADFLSGKQSELVQSAFSKYFEEPRRPFTSDEKVAFGDGWFRVNTSLARYVWLPIKFDGDRPVIEWRDEWSLDEFE